MFNNHKITNFNNKNLNYREYSYFELSQYFFLFLIAKIHLIMFIFKKPSDICKYLNKL
jgi:hypothetical protein